MDNKVKNMVIILLVSSLIMIAVGSSLIMLSSSNKKSNIEDKTTTEKTTHEVYDAVMDDKIKCDKDTEFNVKYYYKNLESTKEITVDFEESEETLYIGYPDYKDRYSKDYEGLGIQEFIFKANEEVTYKLNDPNPSTSLTTLPKNYMLVGKEIEDNKYRIKVTDYLHRGWLNKFLELIVTNKEGKTKTYHFSEPYDHEIYCYNSRIYIRNTNKLLNKDAKYDEDRKEYYYDIKDDFNNITIITPYGIKLNMEK